MGITRKISNKIDILKNRGLCPSILNFGYSRCKLSYILQENLTGIKIFTLGLPILLALAVFCGLSPIQGIISWMIASIVAMLLGGSKHQIASIALPTCVLLFEIISKYQYKGLLVTAIFTGGLLIIFGFLRFSEVLKYISYAFVAAISIYVVLAIFVNQIQSILDIETIQSTQGLLENFRLLWMNLENVTYERVMVAGIYIAPLIFFRMFFKGYFSYLLYLMLSVGFAYICDIGLIPVALSIKTIGKEMISTVSFDNIFSISHSIPSQLFLANSLNYAFVISLIIATETCFCSNVLDSLSEYQKPQTNVDLISTGVANIISVASGGMFVAPNLNFSIKNVALKTKSVFPCLIIAALCYVFILVGPLILRYIPIKSVSCILIVFALQELKRRNIFQYLKFKQGNSIIFISTMIVSLYFGIIASVIVGFCVSCILFARRMVNIKDANVHTTKDHDNGAFEFMKNKAGFSKSMNIPKKVLDKIEVIQVNNTLFLNIAKLVEEALCARGKFPSVIVIYFRNIPYLDGEAFDSLKSLVKQITSRGSIVLVSGTNGLLLDIIQQRAEEEKAGDAYGYIVPNFREAINQTIKRLS